MDQCYLTHSLTIRYVIDTEITVNASLMTILCRSVSNQLMTMSQKQLNFWNQTSKRLVNGCAKID